MWKRFLSSVILKDRIFEYFKLVELAIVIVLRGVENKCTFYTIAFMKFKLKNHLRINLNLVVNMYV
jgi:hypothetical protein